MYTAISCVPNPLAPALGELGLLVVVGAAHAVGALAETVEQHGGVGARRRRHVHDAEHGVVALAVQRAAAAQRCEFAVLHSSLFSVLSFLFFDNTLIQLSPQYGKLSFRDARVVV